MYLKKESLLSQSIYFAESIYGHNKWIGKESLHSEILWLDSVHGNYCIGINNVSNLIEKKRNSQENICGIDFQIDFEFTDICKIFGEYDVYIETARKVMVRQEKICFLWGQVKEQWKIFQINLEQRSIYTDRILYLEDIKRNMNRIMISDIYVIEARGKHSVIRRKGDALEVLNPISDMQEKVTKNFIRIHRSYLVNRNYIQKLTRYRLIMKNGEDVPVPQKRYCTVKRMIKDENE